MQQQDKNMLDNNIVIEQEQYQSSSHQSSRGFEQQDADYPLCLDKEVPGSQNTPLSRLSEVTYQSEIKPNLTSRKQVQGYISQKIQGNQKNRLICADSLWQAKEEIKNLTTILEEVRGYAIVLEKRNQQLVLGLQKQKLKSAHLEYALSLIKKGDSHLDKRIAEQNKMLTEISEELLIEKNKCINLSQKLENSQAQNTYLKELILIANNNYEGLEKKFAEAMEKNKKMEAQKQQNEKELTYNMHEMKNLLTDIINSPKGAATITHNLSFGDADENLLKKSIPSNSSKIQKKPIDQMYRKMFIKTLKGKK